VANNIISLDRVAEDTIADAITTAILRSNVSSEAVNRKSAPGSIVESVLICPNSGGLRGRKGFFERLFRGAKPISTPSPQVYSAEELGRLLMLTLESE
jgi:hypothetical protein